MSTTAPASAPAAAPSVGSSSGHAAYFHWAARSSKPNKLGGGEAWGVWVLATIFVCWLFSIQTGYAVVSPYVQETAHLTIGQVGLATAIYTWVFAIVQFFSGSILDRFSSRPTMWIAAILVTAGAFLYAASYEFWILVLAQIVLALGCAFGFVGAGYLGGKWFKASLYGLMFALVEAASSVTSAFMQPILQWLLNFMTWQELLLGFGVFGVLLVIAFLVWVRDPRLPANQAAPKPSGNVFTSVLKDLWSAFWNRNVILACIVGGATFGVMIGVGTLWGARIMAAQGLSTEMATIASGLTWLGLAIGSPLINIWSNKWGNRRWPTFIATVLCLVSVLLLFYLPHQGAGVALVLMFAVGFFASAEMLAFTIAGEAVPGRLIGSSAAVVNAVMFIVGGLLTSVPASFLPDVKSPTPDEFANALWLIWAVLVVGAVAVLFISGKSHPQAMAAAGSHSDPAPATAPAATSHPTSAAAAAPGTAEQPSAASPPATPAAPSATKG